jgi:PIN domain nuclease of toxin-antitoxin system
MTPLLLDTCAAIWLAVGDASLTSASLDALASARREGANISVSPITAWEIGLLNARGRLPLLMEPTVWFRKLISLPGLELAPLNPDIFVQSSFLPGVPPRDPADRIIAATARALGYRLVTRDKILLDYAEAGHVEALAC